MPNNVYSVAQIFNERLFVIPDYQRGYAWREKQCEELMEDIELLPSGKEHYTGTLVLHPQPTEPAAARDGKLYHYFHVVDGQQRLTTLTILLRVLRQAILDNGDEELAMGIAGSFLSAKRKSTTAEPLYKLTLNQDCRDFQINGSEPQLQGLHQRHTFVGYDGWQLIGPKRQPLPPPVLPGSGRGLGIHRRRKDLPAHYGHAHFIDFGNIALRWPRRPRRARP